MYLFWYLFHTQGIKPINDEYSLSKLFSLKGICVYTHIYVFVCMCVYICCSVASHVQLFATPWTAARQASLSFTISWSLLKLKSIELVTLSSYLIFCCPLLLLPSIFPSNRVFSNESALHLRWPKYWSFTPASVPTLNIQG